MIPIIGGYVKSPENYLDDELAVKVEQYLEEHEDVFLEKIAYYFDAKSHNFSSVQGVEIDLYKTELIDEMAKIKKEFFFIKQILFIMKNKNIHVKIEYNFLLLVCVLIILSSCCKNQKFNEHEIVNVSMSLPESFCH